MAKTLDEIGVKRLIQETKGANKNLNTPIPISTENTTESMAQNVKNIADYVEKAKAAGVDTTKSFRLTLEIDGYPVEGSYDPSNGYIYGLELTDDGFAYLDVVNTTVGNVYFHIEFITPNSEQKVTSSMLAQGARNPIILTPSTTEVDEETYQKLLSDDVDVVFKMDNGNLCLLASKYDSGSLYTLYFTCSSVEGETDNDFYLYGYEVTITKISPHTCSLSENLNTDFASFITQAGVIDKNILYRALREIDLTGTDADRKAKLDKFETYWQDLTGVGDLAGARFMGHYLNNDALMITGVFSYDVEAANYSALTPDENDKPYVISLELDGSLTITPLFSHLEAIIIQTGSTDAIKQANKTAIDGYINNLESLGVDVNKGFIVPVNWAGYSNSGILSFIDKNSNGVGFAKGTYIRSIKLFTDGSTSDSIIFDMSSTYPSLKTTSKKIIDAINEANALAKGVKAFGAIELKASDNAANKAAVTAYLKILTVAGVSTTNGYSVPVRITGNSQEYHGMLNIGTGALLSGVVTDVNENHHYPFNVSTTDGVITFDEGNYFLEKGSNEVTEMLDAIKYSYTAVPFTDTTLSNKAQLEVFLSKVPNATVMHCTYKEIWAGTLHKINGDWYGLLVKNTNSPADNINVKLSADGTIVTSNSAQ